MLITGLTNHADPLADRYANISNATGTVADLLADNRALLHKTLATCDAVLQPLIDQQRSAGRLAPQAADRVNADRARAGTYGDFINLYLCDVTLTINGLQPGGPVRTVRLLQQPTGRCTPQ